MPTYGGRQLSFAQKRPVLCRRFTRFCKPLFRPCFCAAVSSALQVAVSSALLCRHLIRFCKPPSRPHFYADILSVHDRPLTAPPALHSTPSAAGGSCARGSRRLTVLISALSVQGESMLGAYECTRAVVASPLPAAATAAPPPALRSDTPSRSSLAHERCASEPPSRTVSRFATALRPRNYCPAARASLLQRACATRWTPHCSPCLPHSKSMGRHCW